MVFFAGQRPIHTGEGQPHSDSVAVLTRIQIDDTKLLDQRRIHFLDSYLAGIKESDRKFRSTLVLGVLEGFLIVDALDGDLTQLCNIQLGVYDRSFFSIFLETAGCTIPISRRAMPPQRMAFRFLG